MNAIIKAAEAKTDELLKAGEALLQALERFGWKDDRPRRTRARHEMESADAEFLEDIVGREVEIPATARIPADFIHHYHNWYAGCLAVVEANMPSRREELVRVHQGEKGPRVGGSSMLDYLKHDMIHFGTQIALARNIMQIMAIVASVPHYLEGRLHDIELEVTQVYIGDQLTEAELLLKVGHVRAAGAIAGVLLERHLKLLCERHQPPIKYTKTAGISKLNDLIKDAGIYDVTQWRKVQWMADVRNSCDHASKTEPRKGDVADMIVDVKKFVALFVI